MQSKQQKQIKVFLIQTFGGSRGGSLFSRQEKMLDMLRQHRTIKAAVLCGNFVS